VRRVLVLLCAALLLAVSAGPVAAAPPSNDLPSGATAVTFPLPFTDTLDTSEATAAGDDFGCGADGVDQATVWYSITPSEDLRVMFDASASSYTTGVNLFVSDTTNLVACSFDRVVWELEAGTTYYVMVADIDGDANGGTLILTVDIGPPPLSVGVTISPTGKLDAKSGLVTVSGTVTCSDAAWFEQMIIARQTVGRFTIHAGTWDWRSCEAGEELPWSATLSGENGTFAGGRTTVEVSAFACGAFDCTSAFATRSITLRR
jgi:hypothetical protein